MSFSDAQALGHLNLIIFSKKPLLGTGLPGVAWGRGVDQGRREATDEVEGGHGPVVIRPHISQERSTVPPGAQRHIRHIVGPRVVPKGSPLYGTTGPELPGRRASGGKLRLVHGTPPALRPLHNSSAPHGEPGSGPVSCPVASSGRPGETGIKPERSEGAGGGRGGGRPTWVRDAKPPQRVMARVSR